MPYPRFKINMPFRELLLPLKNGLSGGGEKLVSEFAAEFRRFGGFPDAVPVSSGRSGFRLLLESLNLEPGSEVIFPAYTFHPIPVVAAECGLKPVFADVSRATWNIDPESLLSRVTERTRVVVPTHLFGMPAEMTEINSIARKHELFVIEDCAHALGAVYRGKPVGTWGDAALFTFAMSKNLPCWGGGAVVLRDLQLAGRMRDRLEGEKPPSTPAVWRGQFLNILAMIFTQRGIFPWTLYPVLKVADVLRSDYFDRPFLEEVAPPASPPGKRLAVSPISPLQAATGLRQLKRFPAWLKRQVENARRLRWLLSDCPGLQLQQEPPDSSSSFLYVRARVEKPAIFRRALLRHGVDTKPDDMRNCAALEFFESRSACPAAEELSGHCIEIPCSYLYSEKEIDDIADRCRRATEQL